MAWCFHDKQDFKSDLKIEVAREGDILREGQDLKDINCKKNPGHRDFIPFKDLTLEHLPIEDRNREMLDDIKRMGSGVVRIVVRKIKNGRFIKEAGTGFVAKFDNDYFIITNNHVVKTEDDVKHCTVEFHYDDDSRSSLLTSRGVKLEGTCAYRDFTLFTINLVPDFLHQLDWTDDTDHRIPSIVIMDKNNQIVTEETYIRTIYNISQLKFTSNINLNSSLINLMFMSWPDGSISYLKSFYFKIEPIPSNIQELTSIEIHIDEHDGHSRVIPGDVVQFGDEIVVKISESIFQDEVKKCRLVWNGEVIARGTRLYFQQVKVSDVYSGMDLEKNMNLDSENFCLLEFHPIPNFVETMLHPKPKTNMCCIGHPHGGIKMVTFGRLLYVSPERFDNQYRRITQPGPDCQCKEVCCMKYSCGSPVFALGEKLDLCSGVPHFMGEKEEELYNGVLIENINIAWAPYSHV